VKESVLDAEPDREIVLVRTRDPKETVDEAVATALSDKVSANRYEKEPYNDWDGVGRRVDETVTLSLMLSVGSRNSVIVSVAVLVPCIVEDLHVPVLWKVGDVDLVSVA
jgi:hypothetical protein